jgi:tetratricopeptide (TPR) repeat protein
VEEAIACYRKAIDIDPKHAWAHYNLGVALKAKGKVEEAIACFRKAIDLDPKYALAHNNLGIALGNKGQLDEAIACFRTAIDLDPRIGNPHFGLGVVYSRRGRYAEARDALARALELLPANHPARAVASGRLRESERLVKLEARLPRLLRGEDKPASAREGLDVVRLCQRKRLYAAAARFAAAAFAADPKVADSSTAAHRYNAACSAALAAGGKGEDAGKLDDKERARLRKQALDWLRAALVAQKKQLTSWWPGAATQARADLAHWQKDPDLAGIRDRDELAKLPADEQKAFTQLWADLAALLKKAEEKAR